VASENTGVNFTVARNGYDKDQVDRYVRGLSEAYQTAYDEYNAVCTRYNELLDSYKKLEEENHSHPNTEVITKAIFDTEVFAQKIISDVHIEVEKIRTTATEEAESIKESAYLERASAKLQAQKILDEANAESFRIKQEAQQLLDRARNETEGANEKAKRIISEANTEAESVALLAKRNFEQTNERISKVIADIQTLLASCEFGAPEEKKPELPYMIPFGATKPGGIV